MMSASRFRAEEQDDTPPSTRPCEARRAPLQSMIVARSAEGDGEPAPLRIEPGELSSTLRRLFEHVPVVAVLGAEPATLDGARLQRLCEWLAVRTGPAVFLELDDDALAAARISAHAGGSVVLIQVHPGRSQRHALRRLCTTQADVVLYIAPELDETAIVAALLVGRHVVMAADDEPGHRRRIEHELERRQIRPERARELLAHFEIV